MKPYNDIEAGRQLAMYGTVFIMARMKDREFELFVLDRKEVVLQELQNEQII